MKNNIKFDDEFFIRMFIILIVALFYMLSIYSLLSFVFWPNDALGVIDYIIEIVAYSFLATIILINKDKIVKKLL